MAHVKIPASEAWVSYGTNASQTVFPVPFPFFAPADLQVTINGVSTTAFGVSGTLVDGGYSSGTITLSAPAVAGDVVAIYRSVAVSRAEDFAYPSSVLNIQVLNTGMDRLTAMQQDANRRAMRALRGPAHEGSLAPLPRRSARANGSMLFDENGDPIVGPTADAIIGFIPSEYGYRLMQAPDAETATALFAAGKLRQGSQVNVDDYGAVGDGIADDAPAFQRAHDALAATGGTVNMSAKYYRMASTVNLTAPLKWLAQGYQEGPSTVTGTPTRPTRGTWLKHDHAGPMFFCSAFTTGQGTHFRDFAIWEDHPEVAPGWAPTPRDFCFKLTNACDRVTFENVHFHNVYKAIQADNIGRLNLPKVTGQPLHTFLLADKVYDMPRWGEIHLWPYWSYADPVKDWQKANGVCFRIGRMDGVFAKSIFVLGYEKWLHLFSPTADTGSATKLYFNHVYTDGVGKSILIDQNNATLHIDQITTQGIDQNTTGGVVALPGSYAVEVNGDNCELYFGMARFDQTALSLIRVNGQNNQISINRAWCRYWDWNNTLAGTPAIYVAPGKTGNVINMATEPRFDAINSGVKLSANTFVLRPLMQNVIGEAVNELRAGAGVAGAGVSLISFGADADVPIAVVAKGAASLSLGNNNNSTALIVGAAAGTVNGVTISAAAAGGAALVRSNGTVGSNLLLTGNGSTGGAILGASGGRAAMYGGTPIAKQTGVPVTAAGIHAAMVALGVFSA